MDHPDHSGPRTLLKSLRQAMAERGGGQQRLDRIVKLIATNMLAEVCSVYLKRDEENLELCATEGLNPGAVHTSFLKVGEGLVGRIARSGDPVNTQDAEHEPGFLYLPETGEEAYRSFLGVPIQRLGNVLGVLVVQNRVGRQYDEAEVEALEIVAMVLAEMAEAGELLRPLALDPQVKAKPPSVVRGVSAADGFARGKAVLHEPRIVVANPIAEHVQVENARLHEAIDAMRHEIDELIDSSAVRGAGEHRGVLEAFRMFAHDKGWVRRLEEAVQSGLAAEAAVEKVQSDTRLRMERITDPYLRERLHDLDDIANRLIRFLVGAEPISADTLPADAVLIARNIGPGDLLDYGAELKALVLEEGSVSSHASIIARALNLPLVVRATGAIAASETDDEIIVDGDSGVIYLRPEETVIESYVERAEIRRHDAEEFRAIRDLPAKTLDGIEIRLDMNAGLLADLPNLRESGASGVGLYRTELLFMVRSSLPRRDEQSELYSRIIDSGQGKRLVFRTLDIGSDKVLSYLKREPEENPALGWRAVRLAMDRRMMMRMQVQALLRGAGDRSLSVMFPFIASEDEFYAARDVLMAEKERMRALGHPTPDEIEVGAMLEIPGLAFASDRFFRDVDFISIGGNDLEQFFYAADRGNEKVRQRYDPLLLSFLEFLGHIAERCAEGRTPLSFCGEAAARPVNALALTAMGIRSLSMRAAAIGPVKRLLRAADLGEARTVIEKARRDGELSARPSLEALLTTTGAPF